MKKKKVRLINWLKWENDNLHGLSLFTYTMAHQALKDL